MLDPAQQARHNRMRFGDHRRAGGVCGCIGAVLSIAGQQGPVIDNHIDGVAPKRVCFFARPLRAGPRCAGLARFLGQKIPGMVDKFLLHNFEVRQYLRQIAVFRGKAGKLMGDHFAGYIAPQIADQIVMLL